jgi:hypothetical protein
MDGTTGTSVGSTIHHWSGCAVTLTLDSGKTWLEGKNYTLTVNNVPTP